MTDYISRQAAIEAVEKCQQYKVSKEDYAVDFAEVKTELMLLPTADVVDVVRCKDCKHGKDAVRGDYKHRLHLIDCNRIDDEHPYIMRSNDFCSWGERAEA